MFFDGDKIKAIREMIVAKNDDQMEAALAKLEPLQQEDFEGIYEAMEGRPVTIRYLDPPLHEFVPHTPEEIAELAAEMNMDAEELQAVVDSLHEVNPMMGHRGSRLDVSNPGIARMQTEAVIRAAININRKHPDWNVVPEIMLPLIGDLKELKYVKKMVTDTADKILAEEGVDMDYHVGTMIEVPRAALKAGELAEEAEFFSFGTNDLTQLTFGFSRDDAGKFLPEYYSAKIYENDPFARLDQTGVGELVAIAAERGRKTRPDIKLGICGEHGGDPASIEFVDGLGLNYVSCSPYRVPIARLAAAQATIKNEKK
ncbi:putative PEP-binding protein, partial [Faecalibaculum rodentium]